MGIGLPVVSKWVMPNPCPGRSRSTIVDVKKKINYPNQWKERSFIGIITRISTSPPYTNFPSFHCRGNKTQICKLGSSLTGETTNPRNDHKYLLSTLPIEKNWDGIPLYQYKGVWYPAYAVSGLVSFQQQFIAQDTDIIIASMPLSGTTWLKALTFSVVNRKCYSPQTSPLLTKPPHELVPSFENDLYFKNQNPDLEKLSNPRIFSSHCHFASLPESIVRDCNCRIVYICKHPLEQLVSYFLFTIKWENSNVKNVQTFSLIDEALENICNGIQSYGPIWDSLLGYWKASFERPEKVLFLKHEDLKEDLVFNLKRLALFLGFPFTKEEEEGGVIEEISRLCSFDKLKNLEVNRNGVRHNGVSNSAFFFYEGKEGERFVKICQKYASPAMAERFMKIVEKKLGGSGLAFEYQYEVQINE